MPTRSSSPSLCVVGVTRIDGREGSYPPSNADLVVVGDRHVDDCVAAVTAVVAAYRRRKQRIENIDQLALVLGAAPRARGRCNRGSRTHQMEPWQCESYSSYVLGTDYMFKYNLLGAACTVLFAWHVATFELHSCG